jgi:hypothetical protein
MEAKAGGANVIYIDLGKETLYSVEMLSSYGIDIVKGFDAEAVGKYLKEETQMTQKSIERFDIKNLNSAL